MRHPGWHHRSRHGEGRGWPPRRMSRLGHYVRARLRRRIFVWFGVSILTTGVLVGALMSLIGGNSWRQELERVRSFAIHRLADVWEEPARRDALVRDLSTELRLDVELLDTSGKVLVSAGEPCPEPADLTLSVERDGRRLGTARACTGRIRSRSPWRPPLYWALSGLVLWMASGFVARRLARPLDTLARAVQELGEGRLETRVNLGRDASGEMELLASAFNEMATRIERQVADQRELLATVSHELRTPLAHLRVLVELMRDAGGPERTADQMEREIVELDALVGELLASSRLDFGQLTPHALEGEDLARRALERLGLSVEVLAVEVPDTRLVGDATLLGRALTNLLDNARGHGQGVRALRIGEREGRLVFWVEDQGPGLPPGEEARVFEAFYRGRPGGEGRETGSLGLGLALVRRIARAHGGEAFAENRPGGGARVGFTLERAGPPRA
ncbi:MAG: ATP-binding protein [Cystobacter sp.]